MIYKRIYYLFYELFFLESMVILGGNRSLKCILTSGFTALSIAIETASR